ncbi:MAG: type II toxin-antitoxin system RelE/ParE family toxin [Bacteroidia bacterium]
MIAVRNIVWTEKARAGYIGIIEYLLEKWSTKEANKFHEKTIKALRHISEFPEIFTLSHKKNIRKYLIVRQITVYYKVFPKKIVLITFWDNRQNPSKLKF